MTNTSKAIEARKEFEYSDYEATYAMSAIVKALVAVARERGIETSDAHIRLIYDGPWDGTFRERLPPALARKIAEVILDHAKEKEEKVKVGQE